MFTQAEYHALCSGISNDARVLYCLGLRPTANTTSATTEPLNYKHLLALLNADQDAKPYSRGRQINSLLRQLEHAGLIALPDAHTLDQSLNAQTLLLPLCTDQQNNFSHLHRQHQEMTTRWRPDNALFEEMASLLGIIDKTYEEEDIGEFIAYWLGRPSSVFSHFQWTQKFAYAIKYKRTAMGMTPVKKVGTQKVSVAPGIEADDNARRLVEKYSSTKKS
ncbi:flavodoxin [Alteromonas pelagimontana]|uniref:Flavodoxin n=1 Tax=Alteromonas pelagimontana TaxID=1858656 RepID=A0A6M4MCX5_9ALTE|nr:DnaT-like ssDNA-binding domain-containing protein [Alteromonas pelagimontana]QJR80972.1 flavodoxin [Alteromonas pelagimontana]